MKILQRFLKHWDMIADNKTEAIKVVSDYPLGNGNKADIALFMNDKCLAIGKCYPKIEAPSEKTARHYFHDSNFIGCGTLSRLWFYFDENSIIINDHDKNIYPFDELMVNSEEFYNRLVE